MPFRTPLVITLENLVDILAMPCILAVNTPTLYKIN